MKISVSQVLEGKKVKSVKFIDKNTIEVVLEGKATLKEDVEYGCVRISGNALENDTDAFNLVIVKKATKNGLRPVFCCLFLEVMSQLII